MGKGATSRRYSEEFKRDAVALYRSSGKPLTVVARQLGISDTSLGTWARESDNAGGQTGSRLLSGHVRPTGRCASGEGNRADRSAARHEASHTLRVRPSSLYRTLPV
ncbi:MAG: transposase [Acidimicrobiales bacterium]